MQTPSCTELSPQMMDALVRKKENDEAKRIEKAVENILSRLAEEMKNIDSFPFHFIIDPFPEEKVIKKVHALLHTHTVLLPMTSSTTVKKKKTITEYSLGCMGEGHQCEITVNVHKKSLYIKLNDVVRGAISKHPASPKVYALLERIDSIAVKKIEDTKKNIHHYMRLFDKTLEETLRNEALTIPFHIPYDKEVPQKAVDLFIQNINRSKTLKASRSTMQVKKIKHIWVPDIYDCNLEEGHYEAQEYTVNHNSVYIERKG